MLMLVAGRAQEGRVRQRLSRTVPVADTRSLSANMTMGIDMSPLFSEVVACMNIQVLEIKKMVSAPFPDTRRTLLTVVCRSIYI